MYDLIELQKQINEKKTEHLMDYFVNGLSVQ